MSPVETCLDGTDDTDDADTWNRHGWTVRWSDLSGAWQYLHRRRGRASEVLLYCAAVVGVYQWNYRIIAIRAAQHFTPSICGSNDNLESRGNTRLRKMTQPRDTPRTHTRGQFPLVAAHRRSRGFRRILLLQVKKVFYAYSSRARSTRW